MYGKNEIKILISNNFVYYKYVFTFGPKTMNTLYLCLRLHLQQMYSLILIICIKAICFYSDLPIFKSLIDLTYIFEYLFLAKDLLLFKNFKYILNDFIKNFKRKLLMT